MTPSGHNALLILLFSGTLIIAAVAPCSGKAVVDIVGREVLLAGRPGFFQYWIRYHDMTTASQGYLSSLPANGSLCQNYVGLTDSLPKSMVFLPTTLSNGTIMQLGALYEYHFIAQDTGACNAPGVWTLGNLTGSGIRFRPVIAGQEKGTSTRRSYFAVKSTGVEGQYWLTGCPCVACGRPCPSVDSYGSSYQVEGNRVLGVGGQAGVMVQFERIFVSTAEQ